MRYFEDLKVSKEHHLGYTEKTTYLPIIPLTKEQQRVIEELNKGNSVVVDSCVGAGKTITIQELCNHFSDRRILYLTYNKLLKLDAQQKIKNKNTTVQNYHGFVYSFLARRNLKCAPDKQIKTFLEKCADVPLIYDIICIDEYQDLEEDTVSLLFHIAKECPKAQWVFVGDMAQKIYDKTRIDVYKDCIDKIVPNYTPVQFTKCFRINSDHAKLLSELWEKKIEGENANCEILYTSDFSDLLRAIDNYENKDVIIIGPRYGITPEIVNILETHNSTKYNKSNVWTSIRDKDENTQIKPNSLIVTTYDGCKGMERKVCVVIDWVNDHYKTRIEKPFTSKQIITNLFCVAASRGKDKIIFFTQAGARNRHFLKKTDLEKDYIQALPDYQPSTMFDFKFQEDITKCMEYLTMEEIPQEDKEEIKTVDRDENIDLTPCIGMYQEINFFKNYNFEKAVDFYDNTPINLRIKKFIRGLSQMTAEQKALALTSLETGLFRYIEQASYNFITEENAIKLYNRLKGKLDPNSSNIQVRCHIVAPAGFTASGKIDYVREDNIPVELKFVTRLTNQNFLQAAMYSLMYKSPYAYLWNTKTNTLFKVSVKNKRDFLEQVYDTITLGRSLKRRSI
jgi:peroxiredoxin family protein